MKDLEGDKNTQRAYGRSARRSIGRGLAAKKSCAAVSRVLAHPAYQKAKVVLAYFASAWELDVSIFVETAQAQGKTVLYPVFDGRGGMLAVLPDEGSLETDRYGVYEPQLAHSRVFAPEEIDFVLVPGITFDRWGYRIGWGGGYYDRFMSLCRNAFKMAIAFEEQMLEQVSNDPWDMRMDAVATDCMIYENSCPEGQADAR